MEDKLIQILESLGVDVIRQGSLPEDAQYPERFFTFWNVESPDHAHYDNEDYGTEWMYNVNFYSVEPLETYSMLVSARNLLKMNGWIVDGKGHDVASDEPSHTGRGFTATYLQF